jgi:hypothetical protein
MTKTGCYVRANSAVDWDGFAAGIRALGVETTVLATDLGQPGSGDVRQTWKVLLNGKEAGRFQVDENDMVCYTSRWRFVFPRNNPTERTRRERHSRRYLLTVCREGSLKGDSSPAGTRT